MSADDTPCIEFPRGKPLKITLPFGTELRAVADLSKGPPSDCTLIHSLILQLMPAIGGLECFLKVLKVITALKNISVETLPDIASAAADLGKCLNFAANISCMIVDIIKLIIAYLKCIIQAAESLLRFQAGLDFSAADGNPVLLASLDCSQRNATASMTQLKDALAVIGPLFALLQPLTDMAAGPLPDPAKDALKIIPDALAALGKIVDGPLVANVPGSEGPLQTLSDLRATLADIQRTLDALPC